MSLLDLDCNDPGLGSKPEPNKTHSRWQERGFGEGSRSPGQAGGF